MIPRLPASSLMHRYLYLQRKKSNSDLGHLCTQVQKRIERKKELHLSQPLFPQKLMHTLPRVCQVGLCSASPLCSPRGCLSRFSVCFTLCRSLLRGHHYRSDLNTGVMKEKKSLWWRIDSDKDFILLSTPSAERALLSAETEPWIARFQCCRREMGLGYKAGSHIN